MLTTFDLDDYVYDALRAGASGFLLKDAPAADLTNAVRVVAAGDALLAPSITRSSSRSSPASDGRPPQARPLAALTPRETEVLTLIARGLSNLEIADRLVLAEQTVKTHVGRISPSWTCATGPRPWSWPTSPGCAAGRQLTMLPRRSAHAIKNSRPHLPLIFGVDAVHGLVTCGRPRYPQSIGMGATWDPALAQAAGAATAKALSATGWNWDFAPYRTWLGTTGGGRPYETWAEEPVLAEATLQAARESITLLRNQETPVPHR